MTPPRDAVAALRFGLGFRPGQNPEAEPAAMVAQLAALAGARPLVGDAETLALRKELMEFRRIRAATRGKAVGDDMRARLEEERRELRLAVEDALLASMGRAVATPHGFAERMARFWRNHFAVAIKFRGHAPYVAGYEDQAIRPHVAGRFADMLKAVVRHPAMLIYLDQYKSAGPNSRAAERRELGLNENLAREILELHTLGVGAAYGQADVDALARLLTGFAVRTRGRSYEYRSAWAEPGRFELLGRAWEGGSEAQTLAALDAIASHPATARRLSRKLARHFLADEPPEALVKALEAAWRDSDGDLTAVSRALVSHPLAWSSPFAKVRQPQEAVIAALRAAGAGPADIGPGRAYGRGLTLGAAAQMGQGLFDMPGPDGWPEEGAAWITPGAMAKRLDWATRMGAAMADAGLDPRDLARAALRGALSEKTAWAIAAASQKREGFALLLASPDFNRR